MLAVLTFGLYAVSLGNGFTNWDDPTYIANNPFALQGWQGLLAAFRFPFDHSYYPLTHVTYTLLQLVAGPSPLAHHFCQAVLFALTVALVPRALATFGVPRVAGVVAALLWAVHPLRVESVVWAANLKDALGGFFVVASFALYGSGRRYLALAAFAAGLLAKSMFFPLAALFPVVELLRKEALWPALRRSWPFLLAGVAVAVVAGMLHLGGVPSWEPRSRTAFLGTALWTPWWYLGRILWPASPQALYDFQLVELGSPRFFIALALWGVLGVAAWRSPPPARRVLLVTAAAFVLALLPVGGLIPVKHPVADRYSLFPSLALLGALGAAAVAYAPARALRAVAAVLLLALVPLNVLRQREWRDSISLWEANVRQAPDHWTVRVNLADAYATEERWDEAIGAMEAGMRLRPERRDVFGVLFFFYGARDQVPPDELRGFRERLEQSGYSAEALTDVAAGCIAREAFRSARLLLEHVADLESNGYAQRLLAVVDRKQTRLEDSARHARRALELGQEKARIELVYALADLGRGDEALALAAHELDDPYAAAQLRGARAYTLMRVGRTEEGQLEARAALRDLQLSAP